MNKPASVNVIGKEFVREFMETATPEERKWVVLTLEREIEEKGNKKGFFSFRSQFANKFFPEIVAKNNPKKEKTTFLDEMKVICG